MSLRDESAVSRGNESQTPSTRKAHMMSRPRCCSTSDARRSSTTEPPSQFAPFGDWAQNQARVLKPQFGLPEEIRFACEDLSQEWQKRPRKGRLAGTEAMRTVTHAGGLTANVQLVNSGRSTGTKTHFLVHLSHNGTREREMPVLALLHRLTATEQAVAEAGGLGPG